jgi:PhnB protein
MPNVVPMLAYRDGVAAMDWLIRAFGFVERSRSIDVEGRLSHGELSAGVDGLIMLATPTPLYEGPAQHREHCPEAAAWSQVPWIIDGVLVEVDDLDAHFKRARAAGARILSSPEVAGWASFRQYRAEDLEGHRWMFSGR